jgi:uncharacterized protein
MRVSVVARAVIALLLCLTVPSLAQSAVSGSCEALAASPFDPVTPTGTGIDADSIDIPAALAACRAASSAPQASPHDHYLLGRVLEQSEDYAAALVEYGIAAEGGVSIAMNALGAMYEFGYGVPVDAEQAVALYQQAYDLDGLPVAAGNLGYVNAYGIGIAQDYTEGLKYFLIASDGGVGWAANEVGLIYEYGNGVDVDLAKAADFYKLAYKNGEPVGASNLGTFYEDGRGVDEDEVEAVRLYNLAADAGNGYGLVNLGRMYHDGRGGLQQSGPKAIELYIQGAEAGQLSGWSFAGSVYSAGVLVPRDMVKARELMQKSVDSGDTVAAAGGNNALAWSYVLENTKLDEATALVNKAIEGDPGYGGYHDTLAWILHLQGDDAAALPHMEEAISLLPSDPYLQAHAGDIYAALGQTEKARTAYQAALDLAPAVVLDTTVDITAIAAWLAAN